MKRLIAWLALVALVLGLWIWRPGRDRLPPLPVTTKSNKIAQPLPSTEGNLDRRLKTPPAPNVSLPSAALPDAKMARVAQIRHDYAEMRTKVAGDYAAASATFPGGLQAYLRQLALLEQEKRRDLAAVLGARELENLELRESIEGQMVQQWLGDTTATDEQRRAVFRLQRGFDDQFGMLLDFSPAFLLARERERQAMQEQIHRVLGDELFPAWLRGESADFGNFSRFAAEHNLPAGTALGLWRAKNEFVLHRLEINLRSGTNLDEARQALGELIRQTDAQIRSQLGGASAAATRQDILGWLPPG
jgi:hypothetical protein